MDTLNFDLKNIESFLLILFRLCGIFSLIPIFGAAILNPALRGGFCVLMTFILYPVLNIHTDFVPINNILGLGVFLLKEFLIGFVLSFISTIIFVAVRFSGEQIGRQMGIGMARIFDPMTDTQTNVVVQLQYIIAVLVFLSFDGHHLLLHGVVKTFELIPIYGFKYTELVHSKIIEYSNYVFIYGIKLVAPVWVMVIISTVCLGVMSKTAPEMNILLIGFPIKIFMGLMGMSLALPLFSYLLRGFFIKMNTDLTQMMQSMNY